MSAEPSVGSRRSPAETERVSGRAGTSSWRARSWARSSGRGRRGRSWAAVVRSGVEIVVGVGRAATTRAHRRRAMRACHAERHARCGSPRRVTAAGRPSGVNRTGFVERTTRPVTGRTLPTAPVPRWAARTRQLAQDWLKSVKGADGPPMDNRDASEHSSTLAAAPHGRQRPSAAPAPPRSRRLVRRRPAGHDRRAAPVGAVADDDWVGIVNTYRAMSGLDPIVTDGTWSSQAQAHSCYMLLQRHQPRRDAGSRRLHRRWRHRRQQRQRRRQQLAISATARQPHRSLDDRPVPRDRHPPPQPADASGSACAPPATPRPRGTRVARSTSSAVSTAPATADVADRVPRATARPSPLHSFVTESPNPLTMCGWTGSAGLPVISMMPEQRHVGDRHPDRPDGPIETCVLHQGNASDATAQGDPRRRQRRRGRCPRTPLADGTYVASVEPRTAAASSWSFTVDRNAALSAAPPTPPPPPPPPAPPRRPPGSSP